MKKFFILLFVLAISYVALHSEESVRYVTGKITLADGGNAQREVYLFYNRFRSSKDNLIKVVQTDANGEFKVGIPTSIKYAELHLAAPGYAAFMTKYIEGDKNPRVEATLYPRAIPTNPDSVRVYMFLKNGRGSEIYPINNKKIINVEIDFSDDKYKSITEDGEDTVTYTYYFKDESTTPAEHIGKWLYDYNGDYYAVGVTKNDKFTLNIDLDKYRKSDDSTQQNLTTGKWVNSPVNKQYNEALELLPSMDISMLGQNYYYYVNQYNKDAISKLTPEVIEERKQKTINKFNKYLKTNDSLLTIVKSPYLKDYLKLNKIDLLNAPDSANSWNDKFKVLNSIRVLPTIFYSLFNKIVYEKEFKDNPQKYIDLLEKNYAKATNKRNLNYLKYGLYSTLARTELVDDPKYQKYITDKIKEIGKYDDLDNWPKTEIPKTLAKIELRSMVYAPDFSFKTIDDKNLKLSDFKGKWVLLDFWGTWCGPCRGETPHLVKAYDELGGDKFEIISVSTDRSVKVVNDYVIDKKMKWVNTIELDGYAKGVIEKYGINSYPTLMLLNPEGKFVKLSQANLRGEELIPTLKKQMMTN